MVWEPQDKVDRDQVAKLTRIQEKKKGAYVARLAQCGNRHEAARLAGISMRSVYAYQQRDRGFADDCMLALEEYESKLALKLRDDAITKAIEGWDEPVFSAEGQIGTKRKYSSDLHKQLLRAYDPEKHDRPGLAALRNAESGSALQKVAAANLSFSLKSSDDKSEDESK